MIDPDDERTAVSRRRASQAPAPPGIDPDDPTTVSARTGGSSEPDLVTQAAATEPEPEPVGPRRKGPAAPRDDTYTAVPAPRADSSRDAHARRADEGGGPPPSPTGEVPATSGRAARPPELDPAPYRARPVPAASAPRSEPPRHAPQAYVDTAATETASRHRGRRRAIAVGVAASVLVILAAVALIVLLATG